MAIAFDAASPANQYTNGATSLTFSHTCTGSDLILIVGVGMSGDASPTGVTYNGVALTQVPSGSVVFNTGYICELWYLVGPATGAHDVVISRTYSGRIYACSLSYTGVSSGAPLGTAATAGSAGSTSFTVDVSAATNYVVVDICYVASGAATSITQGAGQTKRVEALDGVNIGNVAAMSEEAGAATVTMSWTHGGASEPWGIVGVALKPATGKFARPSSDVAGGTFRSIHTTAPFGPIVIA